MAVWNSTKRRLEQETGYAHRYELQGVPEPNLLRDIFPYDEVPKVVFDGVLEELDPAPEFFIPARGPNKGPGQKESS